MKKLFFLSVHPLCFLTEIPPAVLLWLAFRRNDSIQTPEKLYPLMIFCGCWIVFTFVYFFRVLSISEGEIHTVGPFSTRDAVSIRKEKKIILTKCPKGVKKMEIIGHDEGPALSFLKDREPSDISQMRETFYAGDMALEKIAALYGVPCDLTLKALSEDFFEAESEDWHLTAEKKNEIREIKITVKKDIVREENRDAKYRFRFFD